MVMLKPNEMKHLSKLKKPNGKCSMYRELNLVKRELEEVLKSCDHEVRDTLKEETELATLKDHTSGWNSIWTTQMIGSISSSEDLSNMNTKSSYVWSKLKIEPKKIITKSFNLMMNLYITQREATETLIC